MSEKPSARPSLDQLRWEPDVADQAEPTTGQKDDGWATNQKVPSKELNWRWAKQYELLTYLADALIRAFDGISEGIETVSVGDAFRVLHPVDNSQIRGAHKAFSDTQGQSGATTISCACTDGLYIYYAQGTNVHAANADTGVHEWSHTSNDGSVKCIATDGYRVYVGRDTDGTGDELEALDPADGTVEASLASATAISALAANGDQLAAVISQSVYIYTVNASSLSADGSYAHGAAINAVAIDDQCCYIGGARGTGSFDLRSIKLDTQTAQWSIALPTTAAPTINGIATDGETIAVVTDSVTTSSGTASLFVHSRDSAALWDALPTWNHDRVYMDDNYIVVMRDNGDTRLMSKLNRAIVRLFGSGTMERPWGIDPTGLLVTNGVYDFNRLYLGYSVRMCQKTNVQDIKRRPYYTAATPV